MKYLVAKAFDSHIGNHQPGELLPPEAEEWAALYYLQSALFVYAYVPDEGYDRLPPHLFSAVVTRQEALGLIKAGDVPIVSEWTEPEPLVASQKLIDAQKESELLNAKEAHQAAVKRMKMHDKADGKPASDGQANKPTKIDTKRAEAEAVAVRERNEELNKVSTFDPAETVAKPVKFEPATDLPEINSLELPPLLAEVEIEDVTPGPTPDNSADYDGDRDAAQVARESGPEDKDAVDLTPAPTLNTTADFDAERDAAEIAKQT